MVYMPKSYLIVARTKARFEEVVNAVRKISEALAIYAECFNGAVRAAVFISEKYFLRTLSWASAITIVKELRDEVIIRVIATGGGAGLLNVDYGASRLYGMKYLTALKVMFLLR